jgi:hypothetical protein
MVCILSSCSNLEIWAKRCVRDSKIYISKTRKEIRPQTRCKTFIPKVDINIEYAILTAVWKDILERFSKTSQKLQVYDLNYMRAPSAIIVNLLAKEQGENSDKN